MPLKIEIGKGFDFSKQSQLLSVLKQAINISKCNREVLIECIDSKESDTYAFTDWPLKYFFRKPIVRLTNKLMEQDRDTVGYTLTHELVHCRQGFWKILGQNIWYAITFRKGFPPFEIEAYNTLNDWYDQKKNKNE